MAVMAALPRFHLANTGTGDTNPPKAKLVWPLGSLDSHTAHKPPIKMGWDLGTKSKPLPQSKNNTSTTN